MTSTVGQRPSVIAIICARGGSKGLPRKNLLPIEGKPLIVYTIEHALASGACDVVLVSTDSEEIAAVARGAGAETLMRPPHLGADLAPTEPVLQHALITYEASEGRSFDIVVYLQTTDLFRTPDLIAECVKRLGADQDLDSVFAGYPTHKNYWREDKGRYVRVWRPDLNYGPRQTGHPLIREDTGLACASRAQLVRDGSRIGPRVDIVLVDRAETGIDIHTAFDFWLATKVLTEWEDPNGKQQHG